MTRSTSRARHRALARPALIALAAITALGACGSDEEAEPSVTDASAAATAAADATTGTGAPASTAPPAASSDTGGTEPAGEAASRIISISPTATEMLYAIGAADQVIAVDDQSNFPPEAQEKRTDLSGFTPNVESIASYEPDLVLIDGSVPDLQGQLEALGITVWAGPAAEDFDDIYQQLEQLGAMTGRVGEAAELVAQMQADIAAAVASVPQLDQPPSYFHELDNTLYTVTSDTFIGEVYRLFGLVNIADTAETDTPYPQLSAEFVISQNPDLIFLADADYGETPETVAARDGWDAVSAVITGNVIPVGADISSRWGPRVVEYVQLVAQAVSEVATLSAG